MLNVTTSVQEQSFGLDTGTQLFSHSFIACR